MTTPEVRLERLRPDGIDAALDRAPIAWIPLGALEFHADHLPNGTDGLTGHGLLVAAAERIGGVVLPWSYLTMGTLALPWSFRFDPGLVEEALRQTLRQLPAYGVRLAVVHTGHGPLDLNHLIKRVCAEVSADGLGAAGDGALLSGAERRPGHRARDGLAGRGGPRFDDGDLVGRGARTGPRGRGSACRTIRRRRVVGVYGPNPRFTVDAARGAAQIDAAAGAPRRTRGRRCSGASRSIRSRTCARSSSATGRNGSCWRAGPGRPAMPHQRRRCCSPTRDPSRATSPACRCSSTARRSRVTSIELVNPTVGETGVGGARVRARPGARVLHPPPADGRGPLPGAGGSRTARGPPRPVAGRGHGGGARRDGRVPVSVVAPGGMVRTVRGPVDPAALGITTMHEHLWMDSTPLLAVHGYEHDRHRPVGRRDRSRSALEPGRPHGQLPPDRRRRGGRGAGPVRRSRWRHDRRADPTVTWPGRRGVSSRSPSAPDCTW